MRKLAYFLLTISFILIISGCFSTFFNNLKEDREIVASRMTDVSSNFETFNTKVSLFGDYREEFHSTVLENLFYETMFQNDNSTKLEFQKYEKLVDEITEDVSSLDSLCKDVYYPEGNINSMCRNYTFMYEQVMNYFIVDVESYNEIVKKFNEYQKSREVKDFVKEYSTTKKYIDYNQDDVYEGKED